MAVRVLSGECWPAVKWSRSIFRLNLPEAFRLEEDEAREHAELCRPIFSRIMNKSPGIDVRKCVAARPLALS
jgi:hypothetical protein